MKIGRQFIKADATCGDVIPVVEEVLRRDGGAVVAPRRAVPFGERQNKPLRRLLSCCAGMGHYLVSAASTSPL